jgi:hypothetical protein
MIKGARSSAVVALLVITAGLAIAACGSSSSSSASAGSAGSTSTSATGTSTTGRGGFAGLTATQQACLKSKGVTLPTGGFHRGSGTGTFTRPSGAPPGAGTSGTGGPGGGGFGGAGGPGGDGFGGGGNSKFATAAKACGVTFGGRFGGGGGFARSGAAAKVSSVALKKFVTCVKAHGYELTGVNTSGSGSVLPKRLQTNKKFLAAAKNCLGDLRPSAGPGTGTTTSSST